MTDCVLVVSESTMLAPTSLVLALVTLRIEQPESGRLAIINSSDSGASAPFACQAVRECLLIRHRLLGAGASSYTHSKGTQSARPSVPPPDDGPRAARNPNSDRGPPRRPGSPLRCRPQPPLASLATFASRAQECRRRQSPGCRSAPSADATTSRSAGRYILGSHHARRCCGTGPSISCIKPAPAIPSTPPGFRKRVR